MTRIPTCPRVAPGSPPSSTLRAGFAGGLRPCLTATAPDASNASGRDEETPSVSRTKKRDRQQETPNGGGQFLMSSGGQFRMSLDKRAAQLTGGHSEV
jgi:hypothetical protein